jgi:hypothetical protein
VFNLFISIFICIWYWYIDILIYWYIEILNTYNYLYIFIYFLNLYICIFIYVLYIDIFKYLHLFIYSHKYWNQMYFDTPWPNCSMGMYQQQGHVISSTIGWSTVNNINQLICVRLLTRCTFFSSYGNGHVWHFGCGTCLVSVCHCRCLGFLQSIRQQRYIPLVLQDILNNLIWFWLSTSPHFGPSPRAQ